MKLKNVYIKNSCKYNVYLCTSKSVLLYDGNIKIFMSETNKVTPI